MDLVAEGPDDIPDQDANPYEFAEIAEGNRLHRSNEHLWTWTCHWMALHPTFPTLEPCDAMVSSTRGNVHPSSGHAH